MVTVAEHGQTGMLRDLVNMMIELEAVHHARGWDNSPPTLYRVCRKVNEYGIATCRLGMHGHPRNELAVFAACLEAGPPTRLVRSLYPFQPVAHLIVMEAWANNLSEEQRDGRMLADIPGSREIRMALAVAGSRRLYIVRTRGQEPEFESWNAKEFPDGGSMGETLAHIDRLAKRRYREAVHEVGLTMGRERR